jgi:hypothetical protein
MAGQGHSHGWAWESIGPHTREPGPANQNSFFTTKGLYYRQKYSSVSSAVQVAGLSRSRRWRSQMWRFWAGMVTHGLRLWGRLRVLQNDLQRRWRRLMVEKWTLHSLATALVDFPSISMPIEHTFKTWDICGILLCDKTAPFRVAFYCPQHKVHLCN